MKNLLTAFAVLISTLSFGQTLPAAPDDKAVIYFVRTSSLGFAINFIYFDSLQVIGRFNGPKYIRYECKPGIHLFWARSENKDFVEAEVEAGKIYFIEALPKMGALKAAVELLPIDPSNPTDAKPMSKILALIKKKPSESFTQEELEAEARSFDDVIGKGFEKYNEEKKKGKANKRLEKTMFYQNM